MDSLTVSETLPYLDNIGKINKTDGLINHFYTDISEGANSSNLSTLH